MYKTRQEADCGVQCWECIMTLYLEKLHPKNEFIHFACVHVVRFTCTEHLNIPIHYQMKWWSKLWSDFNEHLKLKYLELSRHKLKLSQLFKFALEIFYSHLICDTRKDNWRNFCASCCHYDYIRDCDIFFAVQRLK